ncbi:MAG: virulence factor [Acidobacteriota bacterium]|nr:virulence factor [Acidobacteriota bacterium]
MLPLRWLARFAPIVALTCFHGSPVIELPASRPSDTFAILVTGDGGWRAIDRDLAESFRANGISVVGLVAPDFFSERKTANEASRALEQLIGHYIARWHRHRVILVGYSRGAGVLPFMISRLPAADRARISAVALLGLDAAIDFKYSPKVLLWHADDDLTIPVAPELRKLRGLHVLCVAGVNDEESICRSLPTDVATSVLVPGSHHLGSNYRAIARVILAAAGNAQ